MPKVMPVMVSFFTYGWTQQCIRCFQKWFPELKIIVIDNNPTSLDQIENWNWKGNPNKKWKCLFKFCLAERDWLKKQSNVILLQPDRADNKQFSHGMCVDFAYNWCKKNNIDIMLCVEPDNAFNGVEWFYQSLEPLLDDKCWITARKFNHGRFANSTKVAQPCPIMVKVDKIKWSFDQIILHQEYYDFAQMIWHKCREKGNAQYVEDTRKFWHYWGGSYKYIVRNERNCPYVTFL